MTRTTETYTSSLEDFTTRADQSLLEDKRGDKKDSVSFVNCFPETHNKDSL